MHIERHRGVADQISMRDRPEAEIWSWLGRNLGPTRCRSGVDVLWVFGRTGLAFGSSGRLHLGSIWASMCSRCWTNLGSIVGSRWTWGESRLVLGSISGSPGVNPRSNEVVRHCADFIRIRCRFGVDAAAVWVSVLAPSSRRVTRLTPLFGLGFGGVAQQLSGFGQGWVGLDRLGGRVDQNPAWSGHFWAGIDQTWMWSATSMHLFLLFSSSASGRIGGFFAPNHTGPVTGLLFTFECGRACGTRLSPSVVDNFDSRRDVKRKPPVQWSVEPSLGIL